MEFCYGHKVNNESLDPTNVGASGTESTPSNLCI
jgi:hypothetical protein